MYFSITLMTFWFWSIVSAVLSLSNFQYFIFLLLHRTEHLSWQHIRFNLREILFVKIRFKISLSITYVYIENLTLITCNLASYFYFDFYKRFYHHGIFLQSINFTISDSYKHWILILILKYRILYKNHENVDCHQFFSVPK